MVSALRARSCPNRTAFLSCACRPAPQTLISLFLSPACVNCVRWSNGGMYLASGGDDKLIMVWKRAT